METTAQRLDEFANKNDMDKLNRRMNNLVKSNDFGNFLNEYNQLKDSMISTVEMLQLK